MTKGPITTHVLDTELGQPVAGMGVKLELQQGSVWSTLSTGKTDADGRIINLLSSKDTLQLGHYRITFETKPYFTAQKRTSFYPEVAIIFEIRNAKKHYHVPLLINGFGYSTYRGS